MMNTQMFHSIRQYLNSSSLLKKSLLVLISVLIYSFILMIHPDFLRSVSRFIRYNTIFIIPIFILLFTIVFSLPGWWGHFASLSLSGVFFALTLVGLWSSGLDNYFAVSGLIPWSDAKYYYADALRLIEGGRLSSFSLWHPLFPAFLAVVLLLTGQNIQIAVSVLSAIVWLCCYLVAREVQRTHGALAASLVLLVLFVYYRQFSGTAVAENLGLAFGCLGFGLLWQSAVRKKVSLSLYGLFLVALALSSRLGAFFVLPLLLLWGAYFFRTSTRFSLSYFFQGLGVCLLAFAIYFSAMLYLGNKPDAPGTEYASTFYDFTTGYQYFGSAMADHPELQSISDSELSGRLYELAFENIRSHPFIFIRGALKQWTVFFARDWYSVYSFFETRNIIAIFLIHGCLYLLSLVGLIGSLIKRDEPVNLLVAFAFIGVFISVPFVPPDLFNRMRIYAATLPVLALLPAVGLTFILRSLKWQVFTKSPREVSNPSASVFMGMGIVTALILGIFFIKGNAKPHFIEEIDCAEGTDAVYVSLKPGSSINVISDEDDSPNWLPNYHEGRFKRYLHDFSPHYYVMEEFEKVEPPVTILVALDLKSNQDVCIVISQNQSLPQSGTMGMCGRWSENPNVAKDRFFYADTVTMVGLQ